MWRSMSSWLAQKHSKNYVYDIIWIEHVMCFEPWVMCTQLVHLTPWNDCCRSALLANLKPVSGKLHHTCWGNTNRLRKLLPPQIELLSPLQGMLQDDEFVALKRSTWRRFVDLVPYLQFKVVFQKSDWMRCTGHGPQCKSNNCFFASTFVESWPRLSAWCVPPTTEWYLLAGCMCMQRKAWIRQRHGHFKGQAGSKP